MEFFKAAARRSKRGYGDKLHRCNDAGEAARVLSRDLGGCSLEQDGVDFYIVGADAVRKKLGETPEYSVLDCGGVDLKNTNLDNGITDIILQKYLKCLNLDLRFMEKITSLKCTMEERTN